MKCQFEFEMNNKTVTIETGHVARQANGSCLLRCGKTVVLAAVVAEESHSDEPFLPLTVQYIEKSYAFGKFPGGFIKRETKPSDFEVLTARIIDRSIRPLFPKGFLFPVQVTVMVLSAEAGADLQALALDAASAALFLSDLPVHRMVSGVRIGRNQEEWVVNPDADTLQEGTLDLFVSGTSDELLMIEMQALGSVDVQLEPMMGADPLFEPVMGEEVLQVPRVNELDEAAFMSAAKLAQEAVGLAAGEYEKALAEAKKEPGNYSLCPPAIDENIKTYVDEFYRTEIAAALATLASSERSGLLRAIVAKIMADETAVREAWSEEAVHLVVEQYKKELVRRMLLQDKKRVDARALDEVRPIGIETNLLPSAHGSCLFTRGQTQALVAATLGERQDAQMYELLTDRSARYETFMVHYNFPGFSVGEAARVGPPGRRELGHGNLAKRALEATLDTTQTSQTIRLVSEILESNGSSSMATVCAGSLALMAADVPVQKLVAGVAMGLVKEGEAYAILSDILGLEDMDGDMDLKVAGTKEGITALQMDIKLGGIPLDILAEVLAQAKAARLHILDIMEETAKTIEVNEDVLPSSELFHIDPSKIVDVIGQAGKTIREIIERFEVQVDLDKKKGAVKVSGPSKAKVRSACEHIKSIASNAKSKEVPSYEIGVPLKGKIKKIVDFGVFVELPGGYDGLLHISKMSSRHIGHPSELFNEGDLLEVAVKSQSGHKVELELLQPVD